MTVNLLEPGEVRAERDRITAEYRALIEKEEDRKQFDELRADGYTDQVCVQNNTVVTDPKKGERLNRYLPVLDKYGVPVRYNCFADDLKWVRYEPKGKMLALPKIYPEGITIPEFFLGKNIVHLPTVKCHIYTTTTGAMKNAFGGLLNTKRHYTHSWIHKTLVDLLAIQKEIHPGLFAVMDGTTAGDGPGPRTMRPVIIRPKAATPTATASTTSRLRDLLTSRSRRIFVRRTFISGSLSASSPLDAGPSALRTTPFVCACFQVVVSSPQPHHRHVS